MTTYLFAYQEHSLALLGDGFNEEVSPDVVHIRNQDGCVLWRAVCWILVLWHLRNTVLIKAHRQQTTSVNRR